MDAWLNTYKRTKSSAPRIRSSKSEVAERRRKGFALLVLPVCSVLPSLFTHVVQLPTTTPRVTRPKICVQAGTFRGWFRPWLCCWTALMVVLAYEMNSRRRSTEAAPTIYRVEWTRLKAKCVCAHAMHLTPSYHT